MGLPSGWLTVSLTELLMAMRWVPLMELPWAWQKAMLLDCATGQQTEQQMVTLLASSMEQRWAKQSVWQWESPMAQSKVPLTEMRLVLPTVLLSVKQSARQSG